MRKPTMDEIKAARDTNADAIMYIEEAGSRAQKIFLLPILRLFYRYFTWRTDDD